MAALALTLYAVRGKASVGVEALYAAWALSPFFGFAVAERLACRRGAQIAATIHASALVVSVGSVALYAGIALGPRHAHAAFVLLVVPAAAWLAIVPLLVAARFLRAGYGNS